jgi:PAS domain S-box-containing protein
MKKAISFGNLRVRLVLLVLLAVIPALGLILYTAQVQRWAATVAVHENLTRIANLTSTDTLRVIKEAEQLLGGLGQFHEVRGSDPAACAAVMAKLQGRYPFYSALGVASPDGKVICSATPLTNAVTVVDQGWFQQALETRDFSVGDCQVDRLTGEQSLHFGYPIEEDGRIQSVLFAALNLKYLNQVISLSSLGRLPEGASGLVVDREGVVLACYPLSNCQGQPAAESSLAKSAAGNRGPGTTEMVGPDGIQRFYAFYPIGAKRGTAYAYVSISIPTTVALAEANRQEAHNLLGLAVVSVLALAGAWFGGHTIVLGAMNNELEQRVQERTKELAHEQMLLRMLMDNMPDTIYFKDTQSRFTRVNRAQAEVLGLPSPDQAIGKSDSDFFTAEHAQAALADEKRILESGEGLISKTERIRRAKGDFRWVTATKVPLRDASGKVVGLVGVSRDVTEQVRAERLLHNLVESLPDLVYVKDTQGRYVADNVTHRAFLGLRTVEDIIGKTAFDFYPRDLAERIQADDQAVLAAKIPVLNREEKFTNRRGEKTAVLTSKVPYRDEQGNIAGLVCISRIVGEQKQG